ncbi:MAG: Arylsulfatase [Formosa sp. Hel1_33_131]|nr:MAG: Arylsulfatase [Formosa sp. Hel1_33_131]
MKLNRLTGILAFLIFSSCNSDDAATETSDPIPTPSSPNILLIIADDMGLDATPGYSVGTSKPTMPNLQDLMNSGVRFNNVWSNPVCTPTRATILTGKYGFRTNVINVGDVLSTSETSLHKVLNTNASEYSHAVIGKWHLSSDPTHPTAMGVDYFAGLLGGGVQSYTNWDLNENGVTTTSTAYTTTKFTDLAIDWVSAQSQPWFLWLAYNAPHTPFHFPPTNLHNQGDLPADDASIEANPLPYYQAMIEAMDSEMGRLLSTMTQEDRDNTLIIFVGDNGTPSEVVQEYNSNRAKGSIYQGGVNVPMVISGKNVTRVNETEDALISTTDLFATIAEVAGTASYDSGDSRSFLDLLSSGNSKGRDFVYTEKYNAQTQGPDYTIRNATHKYIYFNTGAEALYNLIENPLESPNLLNENQLPLSASDAAIKLSLTTELSSIRN